MYGVFRFGQEIKTTGTSDWSLRRERLQHEDDLVNHRLAWLTTAQSIFVAAFVIQFAVAEENAVPRYLQIGIPLVGLVSSMLIWGSVIAAILVWRAIVRVDPSLKPGTGLTRFFGFLPAVLVPALFIIGWLWALIVELTT